MIRCGNCKESHTTPAEVRACYDVGRGADHPASAPVPTPAPAATWGHGARDGRATRRIAHPASDRAAEYCRNLIADRVWPFEDDPEYTKAAASLQAFEDVDRGVVSEMIDRLKRSPYKESRAEVAVDDGVYRVGETVYKVQHAVHGSGNQYAKRLVQHEDGTWSFVYACGAVRKIRPEHKLSAEEAAEFGKLYGICIRCAAQLTREESIHVGYGPTCAGHEGWPYPTATELRALTAEVTS